MVGRASNKNDICDGFWLKGKEIIQISEQLHDSSEGRNVKGWKMARRS